MEHKEIEEKIYENREEISLNQDKNEAVQKYEEHLGNITAN